MHMLGSLLVSVGPIIPLSTAATLAYVPVRRPEASLLHEFDSSHSGRHEPASHGTLTCTMVNDGESLSIHLLPVLSLLEKCWHRFFAILKDFLKTALVLLTYCSPVETLGWWSRLDHVPVRLQETTQTAP